MSQDQATQEQLNAMLNEIKIDELADAPSYANLPAGAHRCKVGLEVKKINEKLNFSINLKVVETLELSDPATDAPATPGSEVNVLYGADTEFGQGAFKNLMNKFLAAMGVGKDDPRRAELTIAQIFEPYKDAELVFITKPVISKKDPSKVYTNIVDVIFGDFTGLASTGNSATEAPVTQAPSGLPKLG